MRASAKGETYRNTPGSLRGHSDALYLALRGALAVLSVRERNLLQPRMSVHMGRYRHARPRPVA